MLKLPLSLVAVAWLLSGPSIAVAAQAPTRSQAAQASGPVVNINTGTAEELATLPGIGARTATRIIEYREKNGPFKKIEELMNVQGIGEKSFLRLKSRLTVEMPKGQGRPDARS